MRIEIPTERTRPRCYDRPPAPRLRDVYGVDRTTGRVTKTTIDDGWASPGCKTWSGIGIGPNNEPYPVAHGFDCRDCRWLPEGVTP